MPYIRLINGKIQQLPAVVPPVLLPETTTYASHQALLDYPSLSPIRTMRNTSHRCNATYARRASSTLQRMLAMPRARDGKRWYLRVGSVYDVSSASIYHVVNRQHKPVSTVRHFFPRGSHLSHLFSYSYTVLLNHYHYLSIISQSYCFHPLILGNATMPSFPVLHRNDRVGA